MKSSVIETSGIGSCIALNITLNRKLNLILGLKKKAILNKNLRLSFSAILVSLFSCYGYAQIEYISLHDIEASNNQALSVKLNIVEQGQPTPLKFILSHQQTRTTLIPERINDYMIRLKGPSNVSERAIIHVYQLERDVWRRVKGINISGGLTSSTVSNDFETEVQTQTEPQLSTTSSPKLSPKEIKVNPAIKKAPIASLSVETSNCELTRQPKETLWSIASRYMDIWQVDVFSAMIAIYQTNITMFSKQHIGQLMHGKTLTCPNKKTIASMGTKAQMKAEFNRLNAITFK